MVELVLSLILSVVGLVIGGFVGEHFYLNFAPYCWYGALIGFAIVWAFKFCCIFDEFFFAIFD